MGLRHGLAVEDAAHERAGERVSSSYSVGHFDLRRFLEGYVTRSEYVTAVSATGENEHVEVVLTQNEPALVLDVKTGIAKHTADKHQFLIINLQDIATLERLAQNLLRIELLAKVDVEDLQAVGGCGIKKLLDGLATDHVALS